MNVVYFPRIPEETLIFVSSSPQIYIFVTDLFEKKERKKERKKKEKKKRENGKEASVASTSRMQTADVVGCVGRINVNDQYDADEGRLALANKETKIPTKDKTDTTQTNTWLSTPNYRLSASIIDS